MKINNLQNILTQNHLATAEPAYIVYSQQEICVDCDADYDKIIYIKNYDDYPELAYDEFEKLEAEYNEATDYRSISIDSNGEQVIPELPKDPYSGEDFDPDDWEKRYVKFIDKFEQAFFIRQNAENYIANNNHNLSGAYIFVESAYRNSEWQQIRELLISAAKKEQKQLELVKITTQY